MPSYSPRTHRKLRKKIIKMIRNETLTVVKDTTNMPLTGLPSGEIVLGFRVSPGSSADDNGYERSRS